MDSHESHAAAANKIGGQTQRNCRATNICYCHVHGRVTYTASMGGGGRASAARSCSMVRTRLWSGDALVGVFVDVAASTKALLLNLISYERDATICLAKRVER